MGGWVTWLVDLNINCFRRTMKISFRWKAKCVYKRFCFSGRWNENGIRSRVLPSLEFDAFITILEIGLKGFSRKTRKLFTGICGWHWWNYEDWFWKQKILRVNRVSRLTSFEIFGKLVRCRRNLHKTIVKSTNIRLTYCQRLLCVKRFENLFVLGC